MKYKLKNGFKVHEMMSLLGDKLDYVFSKSSNEDYYLLLDVKSIGKFNEETVKTLKETMGVIIINNDTLDMEAFNIEEEDMINALMNMK